MQWIGILALAFVCVHAAAEAAAVTSYNSKETSSDPRISKLDIYSLAQYYKVTSIVIGKGESPFSSYIDRVC